MLNDQITELKINNPKKQNSLLKILKSPIFIILEFFTLVYIGIYSVLHILINIIKYSITGIKLIFIDSVRHYLNVTKDKVSSPAYKLEREKKAKASQEKIEKSKSYQRKLAKLEQQKELLRQELTTEEAKRLTKPTLYRFKAKNPKGKIITESFTGFSKLDVNTFLVNEGFEVYSIKTSNWINFVYGESSFSSNKMKKKDLIFWLTQLATYLKSGIPLTNAVRILANQMGDNPNKKRRLNKIVFELTTGESFSKALEKQGNMFPSLLINMIKAAEATGELENTLEDMANYYTDIETTRKQMISAMTYPVVIIAFAFVIVVFILMYIMPQFQDMYRQMDAEVSGITLFIINASNSLIANFGTYAIIFILIIVSFTYAYNKIKGFRKGVQIMLMKTPVIGKIIIYNEMAIFTKTFSSLLKNSVFITESIDILSKITNNEIYREIMYDTINNIAKGGKISETFYEHWAIPSVAYHMIVTGESTGELSAMLEKVSKYYQELHSSIVNSFKSLIEPILIIILAVVVGFVLLAVLLPMYGLYDKI